MNKTKRVLNIELKQHGAGGLVGTYTQIDVTLIDGTREGKATTAVRLRDEGEFRNE